MGLLSQASCAQTPEQLEVDGVLILQQAGARENVDVCMIRAFNLLHSFKTL